MPLRKIKIPPPVTIYDPETGETVKEPDPTLSFAKVVRRLLCNPVFVKSNDGALAQSDIYEKLKSAAPEMTLSEEDWAKLKTAVEAPEYFGQPGLGWHPLMMPQLRVFLDAILNAERV